MSEDVVREFLHGINRQRERASSLQEELAGDAIALLGIADGLRAIGGRTPPTQPIEQATAWILGLLEQHARADARINRAGLLAADFLDGRQRFGSQLASSDDLFVASLDLCLWKTWPDVLRFIGHPKVEQRRSLFKQLLSFPAPTEGEVLQATVWLSALDVLTSEIAMATVPDAHQVARILQQTQGSFRRWRWEKNATRQNTMPARWLIDKEADVQAFLLAVLYPYFGNDLQDEQYLQGFGLRQGRFDFAITSLRLIVEVKILRDSSGIREIEAQIEDDLAIYFKSPALFDTMIVYIYDDRDTPEPEKYAAITDALRARSERIVDVVFIQRPSMIPDRSNRGR